MNKLQDKDAGETVVVSFDFSGMTTDAIQNAAVAVRLFRGTQPNQTVASMVSGGASINGTTVKQPLTGGVVGNDYLVTCTITTSGSETLELAALLRVRRAT